MNTSLDKHFTNNLNQKWLPFIGDNYLNLSQNNRMLVIGESHYHNNTSESIQKHEDIDFTRKVINEMAINRWYYSTKIFPNFHRALMGNDVFDSKKFWHLVAFYNFVQRPMMTNRGRPSYNDYYDGWSVFFHVINILSPKICLFIGTELFSKCNSKYRFYNKEIR